MHLTLGPIDAAVLLLSVAAAVWVGLRLSGRSSSLEGFLLGDRNLPWWAILGSIVATETSTATVLSVPGQGYSPTGMKFLQLAIGFMLGRSVVVGIFLPLFFRGKLFSAYAVLGQRFGERTKQAAAILFLITRNLGDGLRLFLAAVVLHSMLGWPFSLSVVVIGSVTIFYTYLGGMRSVVWNDCIQFVIYMLGGVATVLIIVSNLPGGWETAWQSAVESGKLQVFQLFPETGSIGEQSTEADPTFIAWLISYPFSLWAGLLGGAVLTIGTHGTDQMMVQRYLSARSQADAAKAVLLSGVVVLLQFALFLFIGVLLHTFYATVEPVTFERTDEVYAHFIVHHFPRNTGLVGLLLAAILAAAMSTLSSSLNSSASSLVNDFGWFERSGLSPERRLGITRRIAVGFGILQIGIGIWATTFDSAVVANALTIAGFAAGLLLGLFMLGVLTERVGQTAALLGGAIGLVVLILVQFVLPEGIRWGGHELRLQVAWPWLAAIGAATTFASGYGFSFLFKAQPPVPPTSASAKV